jgi:hypothetical protein
MGEVDGAKKMGQQTPSHALTSAARRRQLHGSWQVQMLHMTVAMIVQVRAHERLFAECGYFVGTVVTGLAGGVVGA